MRDMLLQRFRTVASDLADALRDSVDERLMKWDARRRLALRRAGEIGLQTEKNGKSNRFICGISMTVGLLANSSAAISHIIFFHLFSQ